MVMGQYLVMKYVVVRADGDGTVTSGEAHARGNQKVGEKEALENVMIFPVSEVKGKTDGDEVCEKGKGKGAVNGS